MLLIQIKENAIDEQAVAENDRKATLRFLPHTLPLESELKLLSGDGPVELPGDRERLPGMNDRKEDRC